MLWKKRIILLSTWLFLLAGIVSIFPSKIASRKTSLCDFVAYVDGTQALMQGKSPYKKENLHLTLELFQSDEGVPVPSLAPAQATLLMPFALLDIITARRIYSLLNITAAFLLFFLMMKKSQLLTGFSLTEPSHKNLLIALSFLFYMRTTPLEVALNAGQVTIFAYLFFLYALTTSNTFAKILSLSLACALKYSLFPFLFIYMVNRKEIKALLYAGILFGLLSIVPLFFGYPLSDLFSEYSSLIYNKTMVDGGFDTYSSSHSYSFLQFEFFKISPINILGKAIFALIGILVLFHERKNKEVSIPGIFVLTCVTMEISYHRIHDLVLAMCCLSLLFLHYLSQKKTTPAVVTALFLIVFAPSQHFFLHTICPFIGSFIGENNWIYLAMKDPEPYIFPAYGVLMTLLTLYAKWRYYKDAFDPQGMLLLRKEDSP
jgi:hypothetical protein